ncbi:DUF72 domain-containing protein [Mangrovibacterium diazotrophicum]|uniref:Uncharacterized protein YecE (DUF72 family) n=1 Tax=Mangrovibacterium diazotrophicum TaxID=1261403 RepID=A0A419W468_9BACT|nr:DUF72 domain-containing protein [Mangrovibacterium diazotrophicum]RKD90242.1 uncharacterized protein YecE (DUF72 family) [Mangrovibacterium diazotrophicum]
MKFGQVDNPAEVDFSLPEDHPATTIILENNDRSKPLNVYVGCAKWNKTDLKGFYPRGTKDELTYYSTQFNSIELNATFYGMPPAERVINWRDKTPEDFRFFPKITQSISHMRRLNNVEQLTDEYCDNIAHFEHKLGMAFLQLHDNFGYKNYERLVSFIENFPKVIPLAVELRNTSWFNEQRISEEVYHLLESNNITNILVDTAGRRDLLHMRLTTPVAFVRYVGANDPQSDRDRLDEWVGRIKNWVDQGLRDVYFFVHQNMEKESPLLTAHFIEHLNKAIGTNLHIPQMA